MAALQLSCKRILGFPAVLFLPALLCSVWGHHCSELQYPLKKQKCCRKCQPGTELTKRCGMSSDTTCEPCDPGSYNEDYTESRCKTCSVCRKDMGLREVRPCEAKFNARCECLPGYEPSEEYSTDEKRCKPCREGCFSRGGSQKCQPWTDCAAQGKTQKFPGKREEDAICSNEQVVAPTESTSVTVRSSPEDKKTEPSTKNVSSVSVTHAKTEQVDIRRSNSQSQVLIISMVLVFLTCGLSFLPLLCRAKRIGKKKPKDLAGAPSEDRRSSYRIPIQEEQANCKSSFVQN